MKIPQIWNLGHDKHREPKQKSNSHKERPNKIHINWEFIGKNKRLINRKKRRQDWGLPPLKVDGSPSDNRSGYFEA